MTKPYQIVGTRFDPDEAYARLAATLEDGSERVRCQLWKGQSSTGRPSWSLLIKVGQGKTGCLGGVRIEEDLTWNDAEGTARYRVSIRNGMSYPLRLGNPDVRRMLEAVWTECERQGAIEALR